MFKRAFHLPLESRDSLFVFGPRGTGKTKWLKTHLQSGAYLYVDLLNAATSRALFAYPERLAHMISPGFKGWVVIDEVQKNPALLDEVHRLIEQEGFRFILTGSSARKLKRAGVNLLAGRALRYRMHPLILQELEDVFNLEHALNLGMLPATWSYARPGHYLETYVHTYLREEVMQEGLTRNISSFSRFLEIASFSQGSTINYSEIAREVGIDRQVVANYFSILNDLLLSNTLPAFTKRAKRRLITTDKFYYFDAGVYQTLRPKGFLDAPGESAGMALQTLFYQSLLAIIDYERIPSRVYYWRTTGGVEVDFVVYGRDSLIAFEIKHSKNITPATIRGLRHFKEDYPMATLYVIYLGTEVLHLADQITAVPFADALRKLPDWLKGG